jgi:subtilisin-like proprotein convertase family protein
MIKFYLYLHNANQLFKKQLFTAGLLLFFILTGTYVNAQCIPAPVVNAVANQVFCKNSTITAINFTGTATSYSWTNNNVLIGLAANGTGNINSFTAQNASAVPIVATISVTPVSGPCTGTVVSFTITVNPLPVVTVTPAISCGGSPSGLGPCNPLTASGADSYVWSPLAGLYTNCTSTIPYTGTNTATVFAAPAYPTLYTVTGTSTVTGCSNTATAYVNNTPPPPVVTPASVTMCLGDAAVKLKVAPNYAGTTQFCSGPVNIAVPDNNVAGASNTITVSGIPAPAILTGITVTINMPHTRIGDMVFVLKAPNGNVLNLDYLLSTTGGSGTTTGFVNTVISSVGTAALSSGTNPYTGTFRPDAAGAASTPPAGPTGFIPTVTNFAALYPIVNGSWTLGFYDAVTGEVGTLTSWCISLNYSVIGGSVNSTAAVWTPATGLFMDANATVPYIAGTAIDSVWARPAPTGVYPYQVTTQSLTVAGFTNPATITIPDVGNANPYPSPVTVSGLPLTGATVKSVVLHGLSHTYSEDVDILLQSPLGQNVILMSDVGGGTLANGTYTFADAGSPMSYTTINPAGTYHPTNNGLADNWPTPGPGAFAQAAPALSLFTPSNNNGIWKLFVLDDNGADQGIISGGYTINFDIGAPACTSPPRTVVVTVGVPAVITTQPVNQNICIGSNANFTVAGAGTGLSYQWQVSINGGVTFSNVVNAGVYSFTNNYSTAVGYERISLQSYC